MEIGVEKDLVCYHCGQTCEGDVRFVDDKPFCCEGCKTVFEILDGNGLCEYYRYGERPGNQQKNISEETYAFLDEPDVRKKILEFDSGSYSRTTFQVPSIHCISCIWLLENLHKLEKGVIHTEVNFARKTVRVDFNPSVISLGKVARVLASVGYAPQLSLASGSEGSVHVGGDKSSALKLAIAGFCFGNVMLFSFPEYLGLNPSEEGLKVIFSWLNILLSIPVFFYSAQAYLVSGWKALKLRQINLDVPIAIGLVALFFRSIWDIVTGIGPGYLDSFTGLVFFLLIGRWFQGKTYDSLAFDRDFKSYFPLAVNKDVEGEWKPTLIYDLKPGDDLHIRNMEIIPADSLLCDGECWVDYSFVTGESKPVKVGTGEVIFAGGKLLGQPIKVKVTKKTNQSHLTSLWNHEVFKKEGESHYKTIIDRAAHRFTWAVLALSIVTALYWFQVDPSRTWLIITSVLMVACPCALALSAPFTYGNMLRVFGRHGLYLKNADVIERMAALDTVVFDKTGTVTHGGASKTLFSGELSAEEEGWAWTLARASTHPLSNIIAEGLNGGKGMVLQNFMEVPGQGIKGEVDGNPIKLGSATWVGMEGKPPEEGTRVYFSVGNEVKGYFSMGTTVRAAMPTLLEKLKSYTVALVSGDNESDGHRMKGLFGQERHLYFNQSPHDKLDYVQGLRQQGKSVMMLGDGLNDSGALKQADVGLAITDDTGVFTPACDGILRGDRLGDLDRFLKLSQSATKILKMSFVVSLFYNAIALGVAVSGHLSPLVAAILMPLSSVSVVSFATVAVNVISNRILR